MHGSRFLSYIRPSKGSSQLCAWQLTVPANLRGVAHRPSREEVLVILDGELHVALDGATSALRRGDAVHVPAGSELRVDAGPDGASAWVTTTPVGFQYSAARLSSYAAWWYSLMSPPRMRWRWTSPSGGTCGTGCGRGGWSCCPRCGRWVL